MASVRSTCAAMMYLDPFETMRWKPSRSSPIRTGRCLLRWTSTSGPPLQIPFQNSCRYILCRKKFTFYHLNTGPRFTKLYYHKLLYPGWWISTLDSKQSLNGRRLATLLKGAGYFFAISRILKYLLILLRLKKCVKFESKFKIVTSVLSTIKLCRV